MICSGQRDLGVEEARVWARAMRLGEPAESYFEALVRAEHAENLAQRRQARIEAMARRALARRRDDQSLLPVYASTLAQVVAEMSTLDAFRADAAWIADQQRPAVDAVAVENALVVLAAAGLLPVSEATTRELQLSTDLRVGPALAGAAANLHADALDNARRALREDPPDHCHFASLVVALPSARLPEAEERLRRALLEALAPLQAEADVVYQVSIQVVPRTGQLR